MESLRNFVNRYIAEEGEQFDAFEFKCAGLTAILASIGMVLACMA